MITARQFWKRQLGLLVIVAAWIVANITTTSAQPGDEYQIHLQQPWNQYQSYPIPSTPLPATYRPVANWIGRLILPAAVPVGEDWVQMEILQAPAPQIVGKKVRLRWPDSPTLGLRAVQFTAEAKDSMAKGNIHPSRLDGRSAVGALQSLAGLRPTDNTIVSFADGTLVGDLLTIPAMPTLSTGLAYGLIQIEAAAGLPNQFRVQHYNPSSKKFDGSAETVVIPQQVIDRRGFAPASTDKIWQSPAGKQGWYIYGAFDRQGTFIVQALQPRSLIQVQPQRIIPGLEKGQQFIHADNWLLDKGELQTTMVAKAPTTNWRVGDRALVLHLFGGIGGEKAEQLGVPHTISGHFAFGTATVQRDPFTQELIWDIQYHQVYAHNPNGIIAGTHTWADYLGNLQWGWAATRPISDILVTLPAITTDYDFGGVKLSPLSELQRNLEVMMARYRLGDGSGNTTVSIATSCVQDANQALYATLKNIQRQATSPHIQQWLAHHPQAEQTQRFWQLAAIGQALEKHLTPLGIVRADWENNRLTGVQPQVAQSFWAGLTSWRSMLPRRAHDELALLFLRHGGQLQVLRTNQIGGLQPQIMPLAPTALFGLLMIPWTDFAPLPVLLPRLLSALTIPTGSDLGIGMGLLAIYGAIAVWIGLQSGFLTKQPMRLSWLALQLLVMPALVEELIFRVIFLPHPIEVVNWGKWSLGAAIGLVVFVLYHPLNAKTLYKAGNPTFFQPIFWLLAGLLGLTCSIAYALTGSLIAIALMHWLVVTVWIFYFGGMAKLSIVTSR